MTKAINYAKYQNWTHVVVEEYSVLKQENRDENLKNKPKM